MKTVQMTLDDELLTRVDRAAKKLGTTRSGFARQALRGALRHRAPARKSRARFDPAAHTRWLHRFWKGQQPQVSTDTLLQNDRSE